MRVNVPRAARASLKKKIKRIKKANYWFRKMTISPGGNRAGGGGKLIYPEFYGIGLTALETRAVPLRSRGGWPGDTLLGTAGCLFSGAAPLLRLETVTVALGRDCQERFVHVVKWSGNVAVGISPSLWSLMASASSMWLARVATKVTPGC